MPGALRVKGSRVTYKIDLPTPPGRNGMAPQISLRYDSGSIGGVAGMGWNLDAGNGGVSRCPFIKDLHGANLSYRSDVSDPLCYNEHYLKVVNREHGRAGSEHRSEVDDFSRILLLGDSDHSDSRFMIKTKSGLTFHYEEAVQPDPEGAPATWYLTRAVDLHGNNIRYFYESAPTKRRLQAIYYTGSGNTLGDRRVEFDYEFDERVPVYNAQGHEFEKVNRLSTITAYAGTKLMNRIQLVTRRAPPRATSY